MASISSAKRLRCLAVVLALVAPMQVASATPRYTAKDLGTLGGDYSIGYGINASGQVTGTSALADSPFNRAFLHDGVVMHDLGTLGGNISVGNAINASGQVTGLSLLSGNSVRHAFLHDGAVMHDLGTLGGADSEGSAINDAGMVTGSAGLNPAGPAPNHAFLFDGAVLQDLGALGELFSVGLGINGMGQVTGATQVPGEYGSRPFFHDGIAMRVITVPDMVHSVGRAINDRGEVTGFISTEDSQGNLVQPYAFLYDGSAVKNLGSLGGGRSQGHGINTHGHVVGDSTTASGEEHAFVYMNSEMYDLNDLLFGLGLGVEIELWDAYGINDAGQIVANGRYLSGGPEGAYTFVLTPVPLPAALWFAGSGVACLAIMRRRLSNRRQPFLPT